MQHFTQECPALLLYLLNNSFEDKCIFLGDGQCVKLGRQTNAKTEPTRDNRYFNTKVLSRAHAEVWEKDGKIYIKDTKSANGTFLNGVRLSDSECESAVFELKDNDVLELVIDIFGDEYETLIHNKVTARVVRMLNHGDIQAENQSQDGDINPTSKARL